MATPRACEWPSHSHGSRWSSIPGGDSLVQDHCFRTDCPLTKEVGGPCHRRSLIQRIQALPRSDQPTQPCRKTLGKTDPASLSRMNEGETAFSTSHLPGPCSLLVCGDTLIGSWWGRPGCFLHRAHGLCSVPWKRHHNKIPLACSLGLDQLSPSPSIHPTQS